MTGPSGSESSASGPPGSGPYAVVSVEAMRALERAAIGAGTPEPELQERAGRAVADVVAEIVLCQGSEIVRPHSENHGSPANSPVILSAAKDLRTSSLRRSFAALRMTTGRRRRRRGDGPTARPPVHVVALVGAGNNGRDAVVAARYLAAWGQRVSVLLGQRHGLGEGELAALHGMDVSVGSFADPNGDAALREALSDADVAIDGLLGVGSRGPMRPELARVAHSLNEIRASRSELRVVAVDVPSGVDADTGATPGVVVRADVTVTFGAIKAGLLRFPGAGLAGRVVARPIGLPPEAIEGQPVHVLDEAVAASLVPPRPLDSHKYRFGRTLVVAGSDQYVGAACLGSGAAARSGCGLVALVSTDAVKRVLAVRLPEATYPATLESVEADPDHAAQTVAELLPDHQALLIGPGLGRAPATDRFLRAVLAANGSAERPVPAVIDADALWLLGGWEGWSEQIGSGNVLTPHAGELARLAGADVDDEAPWDVARRLADRWQQVLVFKGPFTTVAEPGGRAWIWPRANPALATGGTGDVLAGLCAGVVAQAMPAFDAARLAVVVHALAAEWLLAERGWRTLLASDLLDAIPRIMAHLADDYHRAPSTPAASASR